MGSDGCLLGSVGAPSWPLKTLRRPLGILGVPRGFMGRQVGSGCPVVPVVRLLCRCPTRSGCPIVRLLAAVRQLSPCQTPSLCPIVRFKVSCPVVRFKVGCPIVWLEPVLRLSGLSWSVR